MTKTKPLTILMPRRLAKGTYYDPKSKCYCAAGYLARHLTGMTSARLAGRDLNGPSISDALTEVLGSNWAGSYSGSTRFIMSDNDNAPTQAARLLSFRKHCKRLGITIIERDPPKKRPNK